MAFKGLPIISSCEVDACYYNKDEKCHAAAINVGSSHPECDTFIRQQGSISRNDTGVVGACHVAQCKWNTDLMCGASKIHVRYHGNHADCGTFEARA